MQRNNQKPYAIVGAGTLAASLWKRGNESDGWRYDFTVFRLDPQNGDVSQFLAPCHIGDLVKLARVLAQVVVDDGCVPSAQRRELDALASKLDELVGTEE
jgi:hypothetical protein